LRFFTVFVYSICFNFGKGQVSFCILDRGTLEVEEWRDVELKFLELELIIYLILKII
jgi:hypothetical protein